jgi:tetratricopeptide (TPR) repeat protein
LTRHNDGTAQLWDATTGEPVGLPLKHPSKDRERAGDIVPEDSLLRPSHGIQGGLFGPDGRALLTLGDGNARLWDPFSGQALGPVFEVNLAGPIGAPGYSAFGPDGKTVLFLDELSAQLWDAGTGRPAGPMFRGHDWRLTERPVVDLSPDGRTVVTDDDDDGVRLWDPATGRQLGPPLKHAAEVHTAKFSRDGRTILTGCGDGTARLWDVAEWPDEWTSDVTLRIEAMTGLTLDEHGAVRFLDKTGWSERLRQLASKDIPLSQRPRWSLDPIVYGPVPTARAKAWIERGRWAEAEAAFQEAVRAWPDDGRIRWERARFFAQRGRAKEAAEDFAQALLRNVMPDHIWAKMKSSSRPNGWDTSPDDSQKTRAEASNEILADRAIADRVCALVPKELFQVLHPRLRARYWVDRRRWTEAEGAFKQAFDESREGSLERCRVLIERGRYFAARGKVDDSAQDFYNALLFDIFHVKSVALSESAKDIFANRAIRDSVFASVRRYCSEYAGDRYREEYLFERFRGQVFDAVFPSDPFAR